MLEAVGFFHLACIGTPALGSAKSPSQSFLEPQCPHGCSCPPNPVHVHRCSCRTLTRRRKPLPTPEIWTLPSAICCRHLLFVLLYAYCRSQLGTGSGLRVANVQRAHGDTPCIHHGQSALAVRLVASVRLGRLDASVRRITTVFPTCLANCIHTPLDCMRAMQVPYPSGRSLHALSRNVTFASCNFLLQATASCRVPCRSPWVRLVVIRFPHSSNSASSSLPACPVMTSSPVLGPAFFTHPS